ncbi:terminase small subunit [Fructilactobacillus vespulae]|uniref:terminase small subunit n=1 Tax=Fructilactobacillus vespulae TaxID=1249630 RepID=UPI0039B5E3D4
MSKRDDAKNDYLLGKSYQEIADKYGVSSATVRTWKSRYKWSKQQSKTKCNISNETQQKSATKTQHVATEKIIENDELTEKQKLFCIHYLRSFNATQSYIKAYGVTHESALVSGPRLLGNVRIKSFIKQLKKDTTEELMIDLVDLLKSDIQQANADIGDYVNWSTSQIDLTDDDGLQIVDNNGKPINRHITDIFLTDKGNVDTKLIKEVYKGKDGLRVVLKDPEKAKDRLYKYIAEAGIGNDETDNKDSLLNAINKSGKGVFGNGDEVET